MLASDSLPTRCSPSLLPVTVTCCSCRSTSAPRVEQEEARLDPCQRRPLAGCRLSRTPVVAVPSLLWPWSPSLPSSRWLEPPFGGRPVLRDHPTSLVPSSSRSFV